MRLGLAAAGGALKGNSISTGSSGLRAEIFLFVLPSSLVSAVTCQGVFAVCGLLTGCYCCCCLCCCCNCCCGKLRPASSSQETGAEYFCPDEVEEEIINSRDDGEVQTSLFELMWVVQCFYCRISADVQSPIIQQPTNANEKTQLISDGGRRYADTYT